MYKNTQLLVRTFMVLLHHDDLVGVVFLHQGSLRAPLLFQENILGHSAHVPEGVYNTQYTIDKKGQSMIDLYGSQTPLYSSFPVSHKVGNVVNFVLDFKCK